MHNLPVIKKKEEFIYELYDVSEKTVKDSTEKVLVESLIITIDERELGNQMLMLTNQLRDLININNAIMNYKINEL